MDHDTSKGSRRLVVPAVLALILLGIYGGLALWPPPEPGPVDLAAEGLPQHTDTRSFELKPHHIWGSVDKNLYPSLDRPSYVSGTEADAWLRPDDTVIIVEAHGQVYVYPEVLLAFHHVINTEIDSRPVAVTSCDLAGSFAVFSREVEGRELKLGINGQLYEGNIILFDHETDTRWLQMAGESLGGPLEEHRLETICSPRRSVWSGVRDLPDLRVLAPEREIEHYRKIHGRIDRDRFGLQTVLPRGVPDSRLDPYTMGLGIQVRGEAAFFSEEGVRGQGLLSVEVGGWGLLAVPDEKRRSARLFRRFLDGQRLDFDLAPGGSHLVDRQTGSRWSVHGVCESGPLAGRELPEPRYTRAYWYSWSSLHPETAVMGHPGGTRGES